MGIITTGASKGNGLSARPLKSATPMKPASAPNQTTGNTRLNQNVACEDILRIGCPR